MNKYKQSVLERIYQSFVCGGDKLNFRYKKEPIPENLLKALEELEEEDYINIVSKTESGVKAEITDKGIAFGNSAT
ncbi:MAG: hypothetical protein LUG66_02860 [Clostridiales bacterium]|nr:hypothetical protein [Clostridiales bacterium]